MSSQRASHLSQQHRVESIYGATKHIELPNMPIEVHNELLDIVWHSICVIHEARSSVRHAGQMFCPHSMLLRLLQHHLSHERTPHRDSNSLLESVFSAASGGQCVHRVWKGMSAGSFRQKRSCPSLDIPLNLRVSGCMYRAKSMALLRVAQRYSEI